MNATLNSHRAAANIVIKDILAFINLCFSF